MVRKTTKPESFLSRNASKITIVFVLGVMFTGMIHLVDREDKSKFPACVKTPQIQVAVYDHVHSLYEKVSGDIRYIDLTLAKEEDLSEGKKMCSTNAETKLKDGTILNLGIKYIVSWIGEDDDSITTTIVETNNKPFIEEK